MMDSRDLFIPSKVSSVKMAYNGSIVQIHISTLLKNCANLHAHCRYNNSIKTD